MFKEVLPTTPGGGSYATIDDLLVVNDLVEIDITITRWTVGGQALRARIKALNLEQQDEIHQAALMKNKKTGEWQEHRPTFCAESLVRLFQVPSIDIGHARALVKKNPVVIGEVVDLGWALAVFSSDELEKLALDLAPPPDPDAPTPADAGDPEGEE